MRPTRTHACLSALLFVACSSEQADSDLPVTDSSGEGSGAEVVEVLAPPPGVDRTQARIEAAALAQLAADPEIDATEFEVSFADGTLSVSSTTESATGYARAEALAGLVPGIDQVTMTTAAPAGEPGGVPTELHQLAATFDVASRFGTPPDEPLELVIPDTEGSGEGAGIAEAASGDRPRTYVVGSGDSLSIIAQSTMGDGLAWPRLYEFNRSLIGPDPSALRLGMELRIPQD